MRQWLTSKLEHITKEFLEGGGYGEVYEAQFIAYLDCRESHLPDFWERFKTACDARTPEGQEPRCFAFYIEDRQELVDALAEFARQFDGPRATRVVVEEPVRAQPEPAASSTSEPEMTLFDLLSEEDEAE